MDAKNAGRKTDWGRELFYLWFFTKAFFFPFHPSQNSSLFLRGSLTLKRSLYEKKRWMYILCSGMCLGVKLVFLFFFHCMTWERKEIFFLPSSFLPSSILSSLLPFFPSLLLLTCIKFRSFYYHHHHLAFSLSSRLSSLLSLIFLPSFQPFSILSSLTLSYLPSFLSLSWSLSLSLFAFLSLLILYTNRSLLTEQFDCYTRNASWSERKRWLECFHSYRFHWKVGTAITTAATWLSHLSPFLKLLFSRKKKDGIT